MEPFLLSCIDSKIENNRSFYGRFQLGPFDTGQGITIANALRRTLLSELTGLAITLVEIQGVSHEYSSIVGVRESVLDILQNLKQLVFKSDFKLHEPQIGYLNISGPTVVRAGDLKLPLPIQCVDPEQYIATLSYNGYLNFKFIINQGKKYLIQTPMDNEYIKQRYLLTNFNLPTTTKINSEQNESIDRSSIIQNEISFMENSTNVKHSPKEIFFNRQKIKPLESLADRLLTLEFSNQNLFENKTEPNKTNFINSAKTSSEFVINQYLLSQEWFFKKQNIDTFPPNSLQFSDHPIDPIEQSSIPQTEILQKIKNSGLNRNNQKTTGSLSPNRLVDVELKKKTYDLMNETNKSNELNGISGFFPIDAIFMPVNKVNYIIELDENYENSKERVILEIWTNGSLHPRHAIHEAIKRLIELFYPFQKTRFTKLFSSYSTKTAKNTLNNVKFKIQQNNQLSFAPLNLNIFDSVSNNKIGNREQLSNIGISNQKNTKNHLIVIDKTSSQLNAINSNQLSDVNNELLENNQLKTFRDIQYQKLNSLLTKKLATLDIGNLDLSLKLYIQLKNQNINTISELLKYSAEDLFKLKNIQKHSLKELKDVLNQVGLSLRDSSNP